jgi:hypothetical protein
LAARLCNEPPIRYCSLVFALPREHIALAAFNAACENRIASSDLSALAALFGNPPLFLARDEIEHGAHGFGLSAD